MAIVITVLLFTVQLFVLNAHWPCSIHVAFFHGETGLGEQALTLSHTEVSRDGFLPSVCWTSKYSTRISFLQKSSVLHETVLYHVNEKQYSLTKKNEKCKNENTDKLLPYGKASKKQKSCHIIHKSDGCLIGLAIRSHPRLPENASKMEG